MSDLRERAEQLFASTEAALEADDSLGRDWIGDNSRLVLYRLLRDLRTQVLAVLPQRPVAGDREALVAVLWGALASSHGVGVVFTDPARQALARQLADAVDTIRPEPLPLREAWLRDVAKHLNSTQAFGSPPVLDRERAQRLLAAYRFLEASFDERGDPDGPDGVTAWQRGFQAGVEQERRKIVEVLEEMQGNPIAGRWRSLNDAIAAVQSRGPVRPDSLRELRQEVREAREENQKLREVLAELERAAGDLHAMPDLPNRRAVQAAREEARALLEGQP